MRPTTVDDIIVDVADVGDRARGNTRESLTADAVVPVLTVGFTSAAAASLRGFVVSGRDFCFSLVDSPSTAGLDSTACP